MSVDEARERRLGLFHRLAYAARADVDDRELVSLLAIAARELLDLADELIVELERSERGS